jgi:hypothetical protein
MKTAARAAARVAKEEKAKDPLVENTPVAGSNPV